MGKWIYGHALDQYGYLPEIHELERIHAEIHICARELISDYEAGKVIEAREGLQKMGIDCGSPS